MVGDERPRLGATVTGDRYAAWVEPDVRENPAKFKSLLEKRPLIDPAQIEPALTPYRLGSVRNTKGERFPALVGGPRIVYRDAAGRRRTGSFFTQTSKMSCFSWSIPAGPTKLRGTCPASVAGDLPRTDANAAVAKALGKPTGARGFICGECYAGKNRYLYGSIQKAQAVRLAWAKRALADGAFVAEMYRALAMTFNAPAGAFAMVEIDPAFFRIHDSGDFFDLDYYAAWAEVCAMASAIRFWAPTRMWVFPAWRDHMTRVIGIPRNLALRPSALWFDAPTPRIAGFAAGSGAGADVKAWSCPAFGSGSCGTAEGPTGTVPCRTCWVGKTPVVYHKH